MAIGDRLVSETAGVATLVLFTVIVTASVGIGVLFVDEGGAGIQANFSFDHRSDTSSMTVTHAEGDELRAGNLYIEGPRTNVTWAETAGWNESRMVSEGDIIQLSQQSAYGSSVSQSDTINIVYVDDSGNQTTLDTWNGSESSQF